MDITTLLTWAGIWSGAIAWLTQGNWMFSGWTLIVSFIISTIWLSYFIYGKKANKTISLIVWILLMGFPYFVYNIKYMIGISVFLCVIPFFIKK